MRGELARHDLAGVKGDVQRWSHGDGALLDPRTTGFTGEKEDHA